MGSWTFLLLVFLLMVAKKWKERVQKAVCAHSKFPKLLEAKLPDQDKKIHIWYFWTENSFVKSRI
jgi:hypothetical protein